MSAETPAWVLVGAMLKKDGMANASGLAAHADYLLDALKAARYAVINLPVASSLDAWPVEFAGESKEVYGKTNGDVVISGVDTMSSANARWLAAALLAAAEAAEAVTK